jgi:hypothetical protein
MNKIGQVLSSKAFWVAVVSVVIQIFPIFKQFITPTITDIISALLVILAGDLGITQVNIARAEARAEAFKEAAAIQSAKV